MDGKAAGTELGIYGSWELGDRLSIHWWSGINGLVTVDVGNFESGISFLRSAFFSRSSGRALRSN
jgi:hypothetical protein